RDASEADLVVAQREARRALERLASLRPLTRHLAHYIDREGGGWPVYEHVRQILDEADTPTGEWQIGRADGEPIDGDCLFWIEGGSGVEPEWPDWLANPYDDPAVFVAHRMVVVERRERTIGEDGAS
ncbi:MAG: hypothetical protein AAGA99_27820, partial [Actinomycetota bacterium]